MFCHKFSIFFQLILYASTFKNYCIADQCCATLESNYFENFVKRLHVSKDGKLINFFDNCFSERLDIPVEI